MSTNIEEGQEFAPQQEVVVRATDNYGVDRITIYVDNERVIDSDSAPCRATLDTTALPVGIHLMRIEVADIAGNVTKRDYHFQLGSTSAPTSSGAP